MEFYTYYKQLKSVFNCKLYNEDASILELKSSLPLEKIVNSLSQISLKHLFITYEKSLTITLFDNIGSVNINHSSLGEYQDDMDLLFSNPNAIIQISVQINKLRFKEVFLNSLDIEDWSSVNVLSFFESTAATAFFEKSLQEIDTDIFNGQYKPLIIFYPFLSFNTESNTYSLLTGADYISDRDQIKVFCSQDINLTIHEEILLQRDLHCNWINPTIVLVPEMLWFKKTYSELITFQDGENKIVGTMCNVYIKLFLSFVSNYTTNDNIKIIGYRTLDFKLDHDIIGNPRINSDALQSTFNLYSFIYGGQTQDKLAMTRNAVSYNVQVNDDIYKLISYIPVIFNSVQNSFNLYMGKKLEEFLDKKLELEKHARETAKEISEEISNSINLITRNLLALIGTAFVGFLGYLSRGNLYILWAAAIAYIVFVIISTALFALYSKNKKDHVVNVYEHYSKINHYVDKDSKDKFNMEIVNSRVALFARYWYSSILINLFLILFIIAIAYFVGANVEVTVIKK
ncbi:hypothetical protein J7I80_19000 [Bacillus sp. ISL-41]|uniref:hypothetical protein n=1 Tax=Bacillus sp. ISL-41 TaxID=2819127 RepID=UPI001BEC5BE7|nr:hypothetical protein [Bacillus sp. ISL-41]MBT2644336.1 hypothetical protein [Bacillus sp. ISL-41]